MAKFGDLKRIQTNWLALFFSWCQEDEHHFNVQRQMNDADADGDFNARDRGRKNRNWYNFPTSCVLFANEYAVNVVIKKPAFHSWDASDEYQKIIPANTARLICILKNSNEWPNNMNFIVNLNTCVPCCCCCCRRCLFLRLR